MIGVDPVNVSRARDRFNTDCSWFPDGRWIASSSEFPAGGTPLVHPNIIAFFVPGKGGLGDPPAPLRVTFSDEHEDGAPSVSPDGLVVAFESHRTGDEDSPSDLWVIAVPPALEP